MSRVDTVTVAIGSPDAEQPYAALGLKDDEYAKIREILGRRPTNSELAMYSVMWSEHCSYKSSKVHLKQFGEKVPANAAGHWLDNTHRGVSRDRGVDRISTAFENLHANFDRALVRGRDHSMFGGRGLRCGTGSGRRGLLGAFDVSADDAAVGPAAF